MNRQTTLQDPQNLEKRSAARSFLQKLLIASYLFILLDSLTMPPQPCSLLEAPTCAGPWAFTLSSAAYGFLASAVAVLGGWAGFGTSNRSREE